MMMNNLAYLWCYIVSADISVDWVIVINTLSLVMHTNYIHAPCTFHVPRTWKRRGSYYKGTNITYLYTRT